MEDRLLKLLDVEQLSSSKFADVISVQRSSVSHILSGRNKPSFDFLQKTLKAFPHLNADWLILGEGKMYETGDVSGGGSLFNQADSSVDDKKPGDVSETDIPEDISPSELPLSSHLDDLPEEIPSEKLIKTVPEANMVQSAKKVVKVILLYGDKSFESYNPGD